jgi:predicted transposase/invertase (TIGR01784 family)
MFFLDPKNDVAFKKIFGDESRKHLTISALNDFLEKKEGELIENITFLDTANLPDVIDGKKSFVDVRCFDQAGRNYIIEMQIINEFNFLERAQYYVACCLARQLEKRGKYKKLVPVIFIGIVCHELFDEKNDEVQEDMISHHLITSSKTGVSRLHLAEYHFVELRKFNKNLDELQSGTDKLLYFIKNADEFEKIPVQLQNDQNIMEAFHVLERSRWSDLELQDYIRKQEEIERESRQEQGFKEEGRQVGLQEGRQEGAQAKAEFIAMNALRNGLTISVIATITGLSVQEIESLQKNIK